MRQFTFRAPWALAVSWRCAGKAGLSANTSEFGSYRCRRTGTFSHSLRAFALGAVAASLLLRMSDFSRGRFFRGEVGACFFHL